MLRQGCFYISFLVFIFLMGCNPPPEYRSLEYHGQSSDQLQDMYKKDISEIREEVRNLTTADVQNAVVDARSSKETWKWISAAGTAIAGFFSGGTYLVRSAFAVIGAYGTFKVSSYGDNMTDCPKLAPVITEINQFNDDFGESAGRIFQLGPRSTPAELKSTYDDYEAAKEKLYADIRSANLLGLCSNYKHPVSAD